MPPVVHTPPIAMEDYTGGALATGFITTFMSPSAAGFFFIKNKDGGLRQCIIMDLIASWSGTHTPSHWSHQSLNYSMKPMSSQS